MREGRGSVLWKNKKRKSRLFFSIKDGFKNLVIS